jgi:hypothetical protein
MKTSFYNYVLSASILAYSIVACAQPDRAGYSVVARGQHDRIWSKVSSRLNDDGTESLVTNSFVEVATSMHYWEDNQWKESRNLIELAPDGSAVAVHGPWKAHFAGNLAGKGAITLISPTGRSLETRPLGLFYHDVVSDKVVQIAALRDCSAELLPPNQIVWKSIFDSIEADVRVTYTKAAIESDLILRQKPRPPGAYEGLNPATTRLELWHEWRGAPSPKQIRIPLAPQSTAADERQTPQLVDNLMDFGEAVFHPGRAFVWDESEGRPANTEAEVQLITARNPEDIPVGKEWYELANTAILVEAVRWDDVQAKLAGLPEMAQSGGFAKPKDRLLCLHEASELESGSQISKPIELASDSYHPKGVVQDLIITVNSTGPDYNFASWTTYYIQYGYFGGTVTLNSSAYLKFPSSGFGILVYGNLVCNGVRNAETVFTSKDDDLYGEMISDSNHNPSYSGSRLYIYYTTSAVAIRGVKVRWATKAIAYSGLGTNSTMMTSSLELCQVGIHTEGSGPLTLSAAPFDSRRCQVLTPYSPEDGNSVVGSLTDVCSGETDTDGDGLPNWWEVKYFGNTTAADPNADSDFDCSTNLQEKQAETNPRDTVVISISSQPSPTVQRVYPGGSVTYSVAATPACPSYQWYRNGSAIAGATGSSLTINNVNLGDDGAIYKVRVTANKDLDSSAVQIAVLNDFWSGLWDCYTNHDSGGSDTLWSVRSGAVSSPTETPQLAWNTSCKIYGKSGFTAISGNNYQGGTPEYLPYTLLTKRHAYLRGHGCGDYGRHQEWSTRKIWFCTQAGVLVEARVREGFVHVAQPDGLDFSVVIFDQDVTNAITPMSVMVAPTNFYIPYHVHYIHTINNLLDTFAITDSNIWRFDGNSGSPWMIARPNGSLVFFAGATTSGPTVPPSQGIDPIQVEIDKLTTWSGLITNDYRLTWYVP